MARRWTAKETRALLMGLGAYGVEWFVRHAGSSYVYPNAPKRSVSSIRHKIGRMVGGQKFSHGAYTLRSLSKRTGYHPSQLHRAQSALNQKWKRTSLRGSFLITDDQAEELTAWLQHDFWSHRRRLYGCVQCGEDRRPPKVWGLCESCYGRLRFAVQYLRKTLPVEEHAKLDGLMMKVRAGRGYQWSQLQEWRRSRLRCRSPS